jgi:hypothetical protein
MGDHSRPSKRPENLAQRGFQYHERRRTLAREVRMSYLDKKALQVSRCPANPPRRRRQGHGSGQFRRRHDDAGYAVGSDQAQPPCSRPDRIDQYRKRAGTARSEGGHYPRRFSRYHARARAYWRRAAQSARHVTELHGEGESSLRGPPGGRGRGDLAAGRRAGARPDRG